MSRFFLLANTIDKLICSHFSSDSSLSPVVLFIFSHKPESLKCLFVLMVFNYGCESWTINKVGHQRIDAFVLWRWRKLLRVSWTARRSNQSILKETSSEYSLEGLMLKLKLQYFGHMMRRTDSLEKTLMLGKIKVRRRG